MRRIDSSFVAVAALVLAFTACSKKADKTADAKSADTSKAVATKAVDTKAPDAKTTGAKTADAKTAATSNAQKAAAPPVSKTAPVPPPIQKRVESSAAMVAVSGGKIDPGMTKAQVVAMLGKPASDRTRGTFTYLLFPNGMEKQVGMSDLVVLENDKVVDAVLRAPNRSFSGTSSSPRAIPADEAAKKKSSGTLKGGAFTP